MISIPALVERPEQVERLAAAAEELANRILCRVEIESVEGWTGLLVAARRTASAAAVIDPFAGNRIDDLAIERLTDLRRRFPHHRVVVYTAGSEISLSLATSFGREGARSVIRFDRDDTRSALVDALGDLLRNAQARDLISAFAPDGEPREFVTLLLAVAHDPWRRWTPEALGKVVCCGRTKLYQLLRAWGQPPAGELIQRVRVFLALRYLRIRGGTVEGAALRFAFSSVSNFSDACLRRTGMRPVDIVGRAEGWRKTLATVSDPPRTEKE